MLNIFKKRKWSKWRHVTIATDFRDTKVFEILIRRCEISGMTQYKQVYISECVHGLEITLNQLVKQRSQIED